MIHLNKTKLLHIVLSKVWLHDSSGNLWTLCLNADVSIPYFVLLFRSADVYTPVIVCVLPWCAQARVLIRVWLSKRMLVDLSAFNCILCWKCLRSSFNPISVVGLIVEIANWTGNVESEIFVWQSRSVSRCNRIKQSRAAKPRARGALLGQAASRARCS